MANTSAPLSEVAIANIAIDILDDKPITSLDDDTKVGRFLARNFGPVRDQLLEQWPWRFARARVALAADGTAPSFGWDYSYTMPTDLIKPLPLRYNGDWDGEPIAHEFEGDKILTNQAGPLYFRYIKRVTNPTSFTPLFANLLGATLALRGATNITGKTSYFDKVAGIVNDAWQQATLSETLQHGTPETQYRQDLIEIRGVGLPTLI